MTITIDSSCLDSFICLAGALASIIIALKAWRAYLNA